MKMKLTTLLFGLLLAVGWTSSVSAQAIDQRSLSERMGLPGFVTAQDGKDVVKKATTKVSFPIPASVAKSARLNAPTRPNYAPNRADDMGAVPPKSYFDGLTYNWTNDETGESGTDVPSTQVAKDPYQIYELLRFVYMDKRFPGPYYNAYRSNGTREDSVYYGGIDGGWNIPYGSGSGSETPEPIGDINIAIAGSEVNLQSIVVYDANGNVIGSNTWNSSSTDLGQTSLDGTTYNYYNLPTDWDNNYLILRWGSNSNGWYGYVADGGAGDAYITIPASALNGATYARVVINAYTDDSSVGVSVNGDPRTFSETTVVSREWVLGSLPTSNSDTDPTDVLITTNNTYVFLSSITVTDGTTGASITNWSGSTSLPSTWYANKSLSYYSGYYYFQDGGTIRIPSTLFTGHNSIKVSVVARAYNTSNTGTLAICDYNSPYNITSTSTRTCEDIINFPAKVDWNTYKPNLYEGKEGYTALIVSVKNDAEKYPEPSTFLGACEFTTKQQVIDYITATIDSVQLLTDGMRIGSGEKVGTVFNCDGTYNKFFFLSKGRARKKSSGVLASMGLDNDQYRWPSYAAEEVPFKFMFEQFSPTGGHEGDQIYDFYSEMIQGHTYPILHDCASVIQNGHQFSMSGNTGETYYGMRGLNFFIPDYRLKYYTLPDTVASYTDGTYYIETVDGRDYGGPYMQGNATGKTGKAFGQASYFAVNFAQYNPTYAPLVGLYLITLEAEAHPCSGYDEETNHYYEVTLNWTSSLNEMSGGDEIPQTYTIYEVVLNEQTGEYDYEYVATVQNTTTYTLPCPPNYEQEDHSKTHTYIVKGTPTGNDRPGFVAWSNEDDVVIPGLKDFLKLELDHVESDFKIAQETNWYRNFLMVKNENDLKALTTGNINDGMYKFTLYRYENDDEETSVKVADLEFTHPIASGATRAHYNVYYDLAGYAQQEIEPYDISKPATSTSAAVNIPNAYQRTTMGIPDDGYLSIKGSGDIIIWPSGYEVNFLSIKVTNGNGTTTTWTPAAYPNGNLPSGWELSPGCKWVELDGAYYLEGKGYMYIPAGTSGNATVAIKAYGDGSTRAKVTVNDAEKPFPNGAANATELTWTVVASNRAPMRAYTLLSDAIDVANYSTTGSITAPDPWTATSVSYQSNGYFYITNGGNLKFTVPAGYSNANFKFAFNTANNNWGTGTFKFATDNGTITTTCNTAGSDYEQIIQNLSAGDVVTITGTCGSSSYSPDFSYMHVYVEGGDAPTPSNGNMIRLAIPIVDQFNESTAENTHPKKYTYVLKYEPQGEVAKPSNTVDVDVQKTTSKVWSYYNTDSIDSDTDRHLTTDVLNADIEFTLSKTESDIFYNTIQGKENALPADYKNYETILQRLANGEEIQYQEMKNPSPLYHRYYDPGVHQHYDSICTQGAPGQFKSYVPSITTMGHSRRYYEVDTLHNTYGAPIWKTGVGEVIIQNGEGATEAQWQDGPQGSTHWTETSNGVTTECNLYFLGIEAYGKLPGSPSNIKYEPYMFRVWIQSPGNNLRGCTLIPKNQDPNKPGEHWEGTGSAYGSTPVLIYEGPVTANDLTDRGYRLKLDIDENRPWDGNISFGAVDGIDDLMVYVRFYYKSTGTHVNLPNSMRDLFEQEDEIPIYNASERGDEPSPTTAIRGVFEDNTRTIDSVTYVNAQGMTSDKPFDGMNIVITRYTDGTTRTSKVIR